MDILVHSPAGSVTYGRRHLGAAVWALTVWAPGHMGAGTNRRRRFGAGRPYCDFLGATVTFVLGADCCANATLSLLICIVSVLC